MKPNRPGAPAFPTPALSLGERENPRQSAGESSRVEMLDNRPWLLPPLGVRGNGPPQRSLTESLRTSILKRDSDSQMRTRVESTPRKADRLDLLTGFIRLHILHHAAKEPLVGFWMMEELGRHGYRLSAGTLYPMLHGLERQGYLRSASKRAGRRSWREYRATPAGRRALEGAKERLHVLFHELMEE